MTRRHAQRALRLSALVLSALALLALAAALPSLLSVSDPLPDRADALYVFAGGIPDRPRCAAELFARGLAKQVVFGGQSVRPELEAIGQPLSDAAVGALVAEKAGVPRTAEVVIPEGTSTWDDAVILRRWIEASGARTVVAVTSPIHSRRARRVLRLALAPTGVDVRLVTCGWFEPLGWTWFLEERPLIMVTNETLKLALYGVRDFAPIALGMRSVPGAPAAEPAR